MNTPVQLEVRTGPRLHLGLMELCQSAPNCFSGLGIMLASPHLKLSLRTAVSSQSSVIEAPPELTPRIRKVLELSPRSTGEFPADISVVEHLPLHHGQGTGTQLACSIATARELFVEASSGRLAFSQAWSPCCSAIDLPRLVQLSGRGKRSGIGLAGFLAGGLLLDAGLAVKSSSTPGIVAQKAISQRSVHVRKQCLPPEWRIVLVVPRASQPVFGVRENELLKKLAEHPNPQALNMWELGEQALAFATSNPCFTSFCETLDQYMLLAGAMFAAIQGGIYSSDSIHWAVKQARLAGLQAVGQSSWGPTVFGFAENDSYAQAAAQQLRSVVAKEQTPCHIHVTRACSQGAVFRCHELR